VAKTLLLYSTNYGLSKKICETIQASLAKRGEARGRAARGHTVDPRSRRDRHRSSIRHAAQSCGPRVHPRQQPLLESKPGALFSVNLVARSR